MRERVHAERCHSLLCPFRLREATERHQQREWGGKEETERADGIRHTG